MNILKEIEQSESAGAAVGKASAEVQQWIVELDDALKREKGWRKDARRVVALYEAEKRAEHQFNILYSNTETLAPALYNNTPRPVVERRFKDADPIGKMVSRIGQRSLEFLIDDGVSDYTPFDDLVTQATLEALVPGRGLTRFKYDAAFTAVEQPPAEEQVEGSSPAAEAAEKLAYETVCGEYVPWDRFRHGYAKQWKDVPWISFEHFMTREECVRNFGADIGNLIPLTIQCGEAGDDSDDDKSPKPADAEGVKLAQIFEIWDKETRTVKFLAPAFKSQFVKDVEDPLGLSGFYPVPKPLVLFGKISSLVPIPLYVLYEEQAKELNRITTRINKLVAALKVRGFYDSTLEGLDRLMQQEDNTLLPAENVAAMLQGQTLEKAIWLMPIEKLIAVLQQLYLQRQQVKTVIYEITGISDILRGASVASETATAQNIKNQWGTLRLKRMQKIVARYVRDCLRIMAEIALTKLSPQTLAAMTELNFPSAEQKAMAQQVAQQAAAAGQQPPAELQSVLQLPTWDDLLEVMRNNLQRNYRIDIETNSTVDAEATEDKANMGEFLNAIAQFMNGVAPMVESGVMPFDAAKAILLAVTRRYRFGPEVEDQLAQMQAPKPKAEGEADPSVAAAKEKAETELQVTKAESAARMEELQMERQLKTAEFNFKMEELVRKGQMAAAQHSQKMRQAAMPPVPKSTGINQ